MDEGSTNPQPRRVRWRNRAFGWAVLAVVVLALGNAAWTTRYRYLRADESGRGFLFFDRWTHNLCVIWLDKDSTGHARCWAPGLP